MKHGHHADAGSDVETVGGEWLEAADLPFSNSQGPALHIHAENMLGHPSKVQLS